MPPKTRLSTFEDNAGRPLVRFRVGAEAGVLVVGTGGWCLWDVADLDVRVRLQRAAPWLRITGVALLSHRPDFFGTEQLNATDLRRIPLVQLEAMVNHPSRIDAVTAALLSASETGADYSPAIDRLELTVDVAPKDAVPPVSDGFRLPVGPEHRRSAEFHRAVAEAWSAAIANGHPKPAEVLAKANAVTSTAVHQWVKEARAAGIMAPSPRTKRRGSVLD